MKETVHKLRKKCGRRIVAVLLIAAMILGILPDGMFPGGIIQHSEAANSNWSSAFILYGSGERWMNPNATGDYTLQKKVDTLTFSGGIVTATNTQWSIPDGQNVVDVLDESGNVVTASGGAVTTVEKTRTLTLRAKNVGTVMVECFTYNAQTQDESDGINFRILVHVAPLINRGFYDSNNNENGIYMGNLIPVKPDSDSNPGSRPEGVDLNTGNYSIVMNEGAKWELGTGEEDEQKFNEKLNLVFGSARDAVTWTSDNPTVAYVDATGSTPSLKAVSAGHTVLWAIPKAPGNGSGDFIDVYVNPKVEITDADGKSHKYLGPDQWNLDSNEGSAVTGGAIIDNRAYISIPGMQFSGSDSINTRVFWVACRYENGNWNYLCDRDNPNANVVDMQWSDSQKAYSFKGKSGKYRLFFYPEGGEGAYQSFDEYGKSRYAYTVVDVAVCSNFLDDEKYQPQEQIVRLTVNGKYDMSTWLNIPANVFNNEYSIVADKNFEIEIGGEKKTVNALRDGYITLENGVITAKKTGTVKIQVKAVKPNTVVLDAKGNPIVEEQVMTITLIIEESFTLTSSSMTMAVGQEMDIFGMLGVEEFPDGSTFTWSVQSYDGKSPGKCIEITKGQGTTAATIKAVAKTPDRQPERLILEWMDDSGVIRVASCLITVKDSTTPITLDHKELMMQSDDSTGAILTVTNFVEGTRLMWATSDPDIVIAQPDPDYKNLARIVPQGKTGVAYITVINMDNGQTAVCKVTVDQYMTELKIDKGERYTAKLTDGTVLMKASYLPKNATSTDVIWTSTNPAVATVDYNGLDCVVHLHKAGAAIIRVASKDQPAAYSVYAECILTVETVPLTNIAVKESNLTMVVGDTYTVVPTLTPTNAMDSTLTWQSGNPKVATVDDKGVIKAISVGMTTITVSGGEAKPVSIIVNVMNKLNTISFEETEVTLEVEETHELHVIFSPEADVNTKMTLTSTDPSIVTVDEKGVITGVKEGLAMVIATAEELGTTGAITCMVHVLPKTIHVDDFSIDPPEMQLIVGKEQQITPIYKPENTTHKDVIYTAGNEAVATVTEEGIVKGIAPGFTIITCEDVFSGKTAICQVTVESGVKFSLSPSSREIAIGKSFTIKKVVEPSDAKKTATWKSSNTSIATVNSSGKVTGKKIGSCTITCTLTYYGAKATCRVKVAKLKSKVKLDKSSIRMNLGSTYKLKATVTSNDSKLPSVKFSSKNKKIATVNSKSGKIKARKVGSTYIVAKVQDATNATARCRVTVIRRATSISLNKAYAVCYIGSTMTLRATVKPSNATIKKVSWSSSDKKVGVVSGSGKVTGYSEGETYITAKTTDGSNKKARCLVKVLEPIETSNILVAQRDLTLKVGDVTEISYTVLPDDHTDSIKMASDNKRVATVTNSGTVRAVGTGNATITITATSGVTATVNVNVVALNKTSVRMRQYDTETLIVHGTSDPITWYSGNNSIATVTNGRVVGRSIGVTYVYAYVNGCRMSCRIEVTRIK